MRHDIVTATAGLDGGAVRVGLQFAESVEPPSTGGARSLVGFLDFDIDQNAGTGVNSANAEFGLSRGGVATLDGLGVEYYIDLFSEASDSGRADLLDALTGERVGTVSVEFSTNTVSFLVPQSFLLGSERLNMGAVVGTLEGPTDDIVGVSVVPEPATSVLAAVGAAGFLWRVRRRRRRQATPAAHPALRVATEGGQ